MSLQMDISWYIGCSYVDNNNNYSFYKTIKPHFVTDDTVGQ